MIRLLVALSFCAAASAQPAPGGGERPEPLSPEAREALGLATDAGAALYAQAYDDALAFRLDAARDGFRRLGETEPASPASAVGLENVALWRALVTEDDAAFDRFYALNDSLTAVAEGLGDAPGARLSVAAAKLHRALAFGRQERYARAGNSFREACGLFSDLDGPDALFGQGVCEVAAGSVPRKYRWLARLFGFRGTVAGGLDKLDRAARAGGALTVDATVGFAIADATLNERRGGSVDRMVALAEARPSSPVLAYLAGYHLLLDRRAAEAVAALRRAESAQAADGVEPVPFVDAHLGLALFRQRQFEQAAPLLERYARTFRGRALVAQSTLHAGLAYELTGDRRRAESLYRRVRAERDYDADLSAEREAERRLDAPLTDADRALLVGGAAYDAGDYDDAVRALQPVVTDGSLPAEARAEAAYRTGRARQAQERWDDALRHFQLAADRPGDPLAKWGPWAVYHIGEVHEATGDLDAAERQYRAVLDDETEFDYHKSLEQRTRAALERIGR
ncbi:tetratricopeptide repeat protein [Rubrivirga sp.]|uniref:tetratricopeptide repeat protein n=1 Tax=Rubrivirga sp. TaxID=1885344 RepID=UPI003B52307D